MSPVMVNARVTAGFKCAPLRKATYTPAKTASPHPKLISSQPPPSPLLPFRIAVATTPQPRSSSIAVPVTSETKISPFEMSTANCGLLVRAARRLRRCLKSGGDHEATLWKPTPKRDLGHGIRAELRQCDQGLPDLVTPRENQPAPTRTSAAPSLAASAV